MKTLSLLTVHILLLTGCSSDGGTPVLVILVGAFLALAAIVFFVLRFGKFSADCDEDELEMLEKYLSERKKNHE